MPDPPLHLTRPDFDQAAQELLHARAGAEDEGQELGAHQLKQGWEWKEYKLLPGFGYLERPGVVRSTRATLERDLWDEEELAGPAIVEEEDTSALPLPSAHLSDERCIVNLWICLSPTYHVPVLYFSAHLTSGSPLTLDQILRSTIFHCPDPSTYPFSTLPPPSSESSTTLTDPSPSFPFLSQGEHPTLGMPAWFLHPCETEAIMRDVLGSVEVQGVRESEGEGWRGKWLETWLMVVGSVVDLKR